MVDYEMKQQAKDAVITLIALTRGISEDEAYDIIKEVEWTVYDFICGESDYRTIDEIMEEYLGLSSDYAWIFN